MPFPIYTHATIVTGTGSSEDPLSDGGAWTPYAGWPEYVIRTSNALAGSSPSDFFASFYTRRVFSDAEWILSVSAWNGAADTFDMSFRVNGNAGAAPTLTNRNDYVAYWTTDGSVSIVRHDNNVEASLAVDGGNTFTAPFDLGFQTIGRDLSVWHAATPGGAFTQIVSHTVANGSVFYSSGHFALGGFGTNVRFSGLTVGVPTVPLERVQYPRPRLRHP